MAFVIWRAQYESHRHKPLPSMNISQISIAAYFIVASFLISANTASSEDGGDNCPLWLAPSYTGTDKEPRYGLIAGKSYEANETFSYYPELAIPLIDFNQVNYNRNTPRKSRIVDFLEGHFWASHFVGGQWEGHLSVPIAISGIAALSSYHTGTSNVDILQASALVRGQTEFMTAGQPHLARGAITSYYNVTLRATKQIPPGMELFADFGDLWDGNYTDDTYQDRIYRHDYEKADKVIEALLEFYEDFPNLSRDLQDEILDFMLETVLGASVGKHAKTVRSLIPGNPRRLKRVLQAGGSFLYRYADMIRPPQWLQANGFCLDTLKAGTSSLPNAGRGAFAAKSFRKGETITISPMLHIADKDLLNMYPITSFVDPATGAVSHDYDRSSGSTGKQLLINYCFGHPESSLLLFPLGVMVNLINHSRKNSNAYITWSKKADKLPNQHQYHDYIVEELAGIDRVVLTMKIVATKDIKEGEEVLLDYGPMWEAAWQEYRSQWEKETFETSHPLKALDMREHYKTRPFETSQTILRNPYPVDIVTACYLKDLRQPPDGKPMYDKDTGLEIVEWTSPSNYQDFRGENLFIVDILDRKQASGFFYNYTLIAKLSETRLEIISDVPHAACTFLDLPYKSDLHLKGAFRHPIGIIDGHFPLAWRDLRRD